MGGVNQIMKTKKVSAKIISPVFRRHLSVILIAILLSAALFAGIAAADEELSVNETQFVPPAEGDPGMAGAPMLLENGTMPDAPPMMPLENGTMPDAPPMMPLENGTMPADSAAAETAESPFPVIGIVAGLGAAAAFLIKRRT